MVLLEAALMMFLYSQDTVTQIKDGTRDCVKVQKPGIVTVYCDDTRNGSGLDEVQIEDRRDRFTTRTKINFGDSSSVFPYIRDGILYFDVVVRRNSPKAEQLRNEYAGVARK